MRFEAVRVLAGALALAVTPLALSAADAPAVALDVERWFEVEPHAAKDQGAVLELDAALDRALEREERLAQSRARADAATAGVVRAGALPDPQLSYRQHVEGVQTRTGEQRFAVGLRQRFPWPGTLSLRERRSDQRSRAVQLGVTTAELDTKRRVRELFHRLTYRRAARELAARERVIVRRIFDAASAAYAAGDGSRSAMLKAQAALARLESRLAEHDGRIAELRAALEDWIGAPEDGRDWVPRQAPLPLVSLGGVELADVATQHRPELRALAHRRDAAALERRLARRKAYPDLSVGVDWIGIGQRPDNPALPPPDEGDDAWSVSVSLNLPIYGQRREAAERQAASRERAVHHRSRDLERSIRAAARGVEARLRSLGEQLVLLEDTVVPLAEESFTSARSAYAAGDGSFLDLLDAERTLLDAREERLRLARDYWIALADLERTVGADLALERRPSPNRRDDDAS